MSAFFGGILILAAVVGVVYFGTTLVVDIRKRVREKKMNDKVDKK